MSLVILEGVDRTGKSTVAEYYRRQGFTVLHMSAPPKELSAPGYTGPSYLDQMVDILGEAAHKDVLLDRSHYGECIWPQIYNRKPHLNDDDYEILRELEESVGVERILMHDPNADAHWKRCVENKEPLTHGQFLKARQLYDRLADKFGFTRKTLADYSPNAPGAETNKQPAGSNSNPSTASQAGSAQQSGGELDGTGRVHGVHEASISPEQLKLEKANTINDVLSKRIIKSKGNMYDELESDIRNFLKDKLGKIFGESANTDFTKEEIKYLKAIAHQIKAKESK